MLPEKWNLLGSGEDLRAGAEALDGPTLTAARGWAGELGIALLAGSIAERAEGAERLFNTSALIGPEGELGAVYRKIHMFDVEAGGVTYRESAHEQPGEEIVLGRGRRRPVGLTVCYDLRFPELYRILAVRGARVITVPSAFTLATGRDHWEVLLRARAIENQAFLVAANQAGGAAAVRVVRAFDDRRPVGNGARRGCGRGGLHRRRPRSLERDRIRTTLPSLANRQPHAYRWPELMEAALMAKAPPVDRRRQILDAAIRVFARQGFHHCRVSDIAREAGVAYGLVYHYFDTKEQVLNELFVERWSLLLAAIDEVDQRPIPSREKLDAVARFIIDSYRHDPELMKVIIVEVTRAANSFGRTHLPEISNAYEKIAKIVSDAQASGEFRGDIDPMFASMWFYGAIEQLLSGWVFELIGDSDADSPAPRDGRRDDLRRTRKGADNAR